MIRSTMKNQFFDAKLGERITEQNRAVRQKNRGGPGDFGYAGIFIS